MAKRIRTKVQGVYTRSSDTRRFQGKPDVCFDITYKDGCRKVWEKVGWRSEGYSVGVAAQIRAERMRTIRHGDEFPRKRQRITLKEIWALYEQRGLGDLKTPQDWRDRWRKWIAPRFADMTLDSITSDDIEKFKSDLLQYGLAPQTIVHLMRLLRSLFRKAEGWGLFSGRSPAAAVLMPKIDNARLRYFTPEEAHRLLAALERRPRMRSLALLSLHTGMRAGELIELKEKDVNLEAGHVHVLDAKSGTRLVYLTELAKSTLAELLTGNPNEHVFPGRFGGKLAELPDVFSQTINALGFNDGINDRRQRAVFHTLRHTFGSWAAQRGVELHMIAQLMGHSTLEVTRRYAKFASENKFEALAKVEAMFMHDS